MKKFVFKCLNCGELAPTYPNEKNSNWLMLDKNKPCPKCGSKNYGLRLIDWKPSNEDKLI